MRRTRGTIRESRALFRPPGVFYGSGLMRAVAVFALFTVACASAPPPKKDGPTIERTEEKIDLSGEWNDVDADAVAEAIIKKSMGNPWAETLSDGQRSKGGRPPRAGPQQVRRLHRHEVLHEADRSRAHQLGPRRRREQPRRGRRDARRAGGPGGERIR